MQKETMASVKGLGALVRMSKTTKSEIKKGTYALMSRVSCDSFEIAKATKASANGLQRHQRKALVRVSKTTKYSGEILTR